jgi:hypothetical protein
MHRAEVSDGHCRVESARDTCVSQSLGHPSSGTVSIDIDNIINASITAGPGATLWMVRVIAQTTTQTSS